MSGEKNNLTSLPSTVVQVIDEFVGAMHADEAIDNEAVNRLSKLLKENIAVRPEDIHTALFEVPTQSQKA